MDKKMNFKYFYGTEADQFSFYRIPKALFTNDCFKDLSCDAKILYGLMLDRMSLSIKNQWFDEENRAYIYFSIEDIMELLNCGRNKAVKSLQELDDEKGIGLIEKRRQGFGKVTIIYVMEPGEITTIKAMARTAGVGSQQVTIEKGPIYRYADYGLGTYLTEPYYISYGSVRATAYCIQPAKPGPGSGIYTITKLADNQALAKVCYYGTDAAGAESYFANKHRDFSSGKRFILVHMAAAYAYGSSDAFYGTNATGQELAMDIYNYCVKKPEIPDVSMSFSDANVKAYVEGNTQRTKEITFHAAGQQSVTISLPSGVRFHNVSTGSTSAPGAKVTIQGGTKFYLSAPLTQASDTAEVFATTMAGGLKKDYSAYKLTTNGSVQDLAFIFGEGVETTNKVSLNVTWTKQAEIAIVKNDKATGNHLAGAIYGVYRDKECSDLITQMSV